MSDIGNLIKTKREKLGLTLEAVGDAVGVSKSTVRKWETGYISNMRRDKISKLAKVLQLKPTDLIGSDEAATEFLTSEQIELLNMYNTLSPEQKVLVEGVMKGLLGKK